MSKLIDDLRRNNYNDKSLYHRAADHIEQLESVVEGLHKASVNQIRGDRIKYIDSYGTTLYCTIMSVRNGLLRVLPDGRGKTTLTLHPTWDIEYLN